MRGFHLSFGTIGMLFFLATGQYMARVAGVPELDDAQRLLYRSGHLYILLPFVTCVIMGAYMPRDQRATVFQWLISGLLVLASLLISIGFFTESTGTSIDRDLTRLGLIVMFIIPSLLVSKELLTLLRRH